MKCYKLIKDLPTFKAGDTFHISEGGGLFHDESGVMAYAKPTLDESPNILRDWFEEIEDDEPWRPKMGESYYFVSTRGDCGEDFWSGGGMDGGRLEVGNCFKTEEDAEKAVEWLKAFKVLRDDTKGYNGVGGFSSHVYYNIYFKELRVLVDGTNINSGITFRTGGDAEDSIRKHRKEWLTFLGVEEEDE